MFIDHRGGVPAKVGKEDTVGGQVLRPSRLAVALPVPGQLVHGGGTPRHGPPAPRCTRIPQGGRTGGGRTVYPIVHGRHAEFLKREIKLKKAVKLSVSVKMEHAV